MAWKKAEYQKVRDKMKPGDVIALKDKKKEISRYNTLNPAGWGE